MLRDKDDEAKTLLFKVVDAIVLIDEKLKEQNSVLAIARGDKASKDNDELPSVDFRMQTSRFLVELECWRKAITVLEGIVGEDDEQVEAWYLLAFGLFRLKKYQSAEECC